MAWGPGPASDGDYGCRARAGYYIPLEVSRLSYPQRATVGLDEKEEEDGLEVWSRQASAVSVFACTGSECYGSEPEDCSCTALCVHVLHLRVCV